MSVSATEIVDVYRGTATTVLGDLDDDNGVTDSAVLSGISMSITEKSRHIFDPSSGEQRTIRWAVGRALSTLDIRSDDRVKSRSTGKTFAVRESTFIPRTIAGTATLVLDLAHV